MRARLAFAAATIAFGLALSSATSADVRTKIDMPCDKLAEGAVCEDSVSIPDVGFRGACVRVQFGEGRSRLRCEPKGGFNDLQQRCVGDDFADLRCFLANDVDGICVPGETRRITNLGGEGETEVKILECQRAGRFIRAPLPTQAYIVAGGVVLSIGALVAFLRRRTKPKPAD